MKKNNLKYVLILRNLLIFQNLVVIFFISNSIIYANDPYCASFGPYSYFATKINVRGWGHKVFYSVGKFCSIGNDLTILLGGNHRSDWITTYPFPAFQEFQKGCNVLDFCTTKGDIIIKNDVWIGDNVTILSGVTIHDGAVVAACSLVTKDVPPYAIVGGNPAKIIRYRFDSKIIELLLKIQWWDWPIERIKESVPLLCSNDIQTFVSTFIDERE